MVQGDVRAHPQALYGVNYTTMETAFDMSMQQSMSAQQHMEGPQVLVTFKVNYGTEYGQCMAIVGENEATGEWKNFSKGLMQWTEGNWWQISFLTNARKPFMYKYVVVDYATKQPLRWEEGRNRICDPEFLTQVNTDDEI